MSSSHEKALGRKMSKEIASREGHGSQTGKHTPWHKEAKKGFPKSKKPSSVFGKKLGEKLLNRDRGDRPYTKE